MSEEDTGNPERGERIAKWLARAGVASRRDAEALIEEGLVTLNGRRVETPATFVAEGDAVLVRGQRVGAAEPTRLFRYHKPDGLVTTHKDEKGRQTVFDALPPGLPRLISVGRLDLNSEGLLLLTNDGELARKLELPSNGWIRRYRVRVNGRFTPNGVSGTLSVRSVLRSSSGRVLDRCRTGRVSFAAML